VNAQPEHLSSVIYEYAKRYRQAGLFPLPIKPGLKSPLPTRWQVLDDIDLSEFTRPGIGIGLRMGMQPDGRNLFAVDVDPKNNGDRSWEAFIKGHDAPFTAWHDTPSGGWHQFYEAPADFEVSNGQFLPGVDVKGHHGQVVAPPTVLPHGAYTFRDSILRTEVALAPSFVMEQFERRAIPAIERPTPSLAVDRDTPDEWVRRHLTWDSYLPKHGFGIMGMSDRDLYVRRPDKTDAGHSGVAHFEGALVLFTTEIPDVLAPLMRPTRDGSGLSCSLFAFIAAYEHDGDMTACGRWVRREYMAPPLPVGGTAKGVHGAAPDPTVPMRLAQVNDAYWSATPLKAQIRQAAWARRVSPDALDLAMYALQSCLVPPGYMLESPVGPQPLNILSCLVASTGDFKTNTLGAALDLLGPFPPWVDTIGMGSGEGIGAMFLKDEEEVDSKTGRKTRTGRLVRNDLKAVFFEADEGSGLSVQAARNGATVIANLCKAWSGSMLGEGNADKTTRRRVLRNDYRVGAYVNIQPSNFGLLFSEANTGTGLTGRFLFSGTLDANMPLVRPEWPGPVSFPQWSQKPLLITMDPSLLADADAAVVERHLTGGLTTANPMAQVAASLARIAALNALADGRFHVERSDFELAQVRAAASMASLDVLDQYFGVVQRDKGHQASEAKAASAVGTREAEDRIWLKKATDRVMAILQAGPLSSGHLQARLSANQRPYLEQALSALVDIGQIRLDGERYTRT